MALRKITAFTCVAAVGWGFGGTAAATPRAHVSVTAPPRIVVTGQMVRLRGRAPRLARLSLEQWAGGRWVVRGRAREHLKRFSVVWRAPDTGGVVRLRIRARCARCGLSSTRPVRVAVSPTEVLSPARVRAAPAPGSAGTVRYTGRAGLRAGRFVALGVGPRTPFGLLGRVVRVRAEAGDTLAAVEPAGLTEVVPEGRLRSARLRPAAAGATPRDFRAALGCAGGVRAELFGALDVALEPHFKLDWSPGGIDKAEASATIRGDAQLTARVSGAASCSLEETSVASWDAPPLRFFAGPIPVVIVPRTTLYVSAAAEASSAVDVGLLGRLTASAGLRYDGAVHPIGSFEPRFSYTAPKGRTTASIGARVTPSITFLMYGQAGPRFDLSTGLQLDAAAGGDPWWTLTAPVELSAGLAVPHVAELEIPQRTVLSRTFPVAQAPPGPVAQATPPPGAGPMSERARIAWDTSGSDVDLHVWDDHGNHAWWGNPDAVPGGRLSGDDTDGLGPELFSTAGGGPFTYGLCYFDDRDTGPARVTARITGSDGVAHESTHLLAHKRDHLLVGGGNGTFEPPEGWCSG